MAIEELPDIHEIDVSDLFSSLYTTEEPTEVVEEDIADPVDDIVDEDVEEEPVVEETTDDNQPPEETEEDAEEEVEEESEEEDKPKEEEDAKKQDKSAMRRLLEKKERLVREKEATLRRREMEIENKAKDIESDPDIKTAREVAAMVRNKQFGKLVKLHGIDEAEFLKYYGIDDPKKANELAVSAEIRAEREALEAQRLEAQKEIQQADEVKRYHQAKQILTNTVTSEISNYKVLKVLELPELLEEVEAGVSKVVASGQADHLTLPELTREVLKHFDTTWSKRAEKINSAIKAPPPSKKSDVSKKSEGAGKTTATKAKGKARPAATLNNKNSTPATPTKPKPKLEWTPDNSDEFDIAVASDFLKDFKG